MAREIVRNFTNFEICCADNKPGIPGSVCLYEGGSVYLPEGYWHINFSAGVDIPKNNADKISFEIEFDYGEGLVAIASGLIPPDNEREWIHADYPVELDGKTPINIVVTILPDINTKMNYATFRATQEIKM